MKKMILAGLIFSMVQTNVLAAPCEKGTEKKLAKEVSKVVSRMPASEKDEASRVKTFKVTFKDRTKCLGAIGLSLGRLVLGTPGTAFALVGDVGSETINSIGSTLMGLYTDEENNIFLKTKPVFLARNYSKAVANAIATDLAEYCIFTEDYALSPEKWH